MHRRPVQRLVSWLVLAAVLVIVVVFRQQLGLNAELLERLKTNFTNNFIVDQRWRWLLSGLGQTILITVFAVALGVVIGLSIALIKVLEHNGKKLFFLTRFANLYLTVIRGTPVVVQLLIIYYVIFGSVNISKVLVASLAFGINSGAGADDLRDIGTAVDAERQ